MEFEYLVYVAGGEVSEEGGGGSLQLVLLQVEEGEPAVGGVGEGDPARADEPGGLLQIQCTRSSLNCTA